jgi:formate hydrogenlyase transcriptional activator
VVERSVLVCDSDLFAVDTSWLSSAKLRPAGSSALLPERLLQQERKIIESALAQSSGKVSGPAGAAAKLGVPPSTLESKIKSLKIRKAAFKPN